MSRRSHVVHPGGFVRAEQNAAFEMGRLLCQVSKSSLSMNLPEREGRKDVALWAKREVGLTYSHTARLMDVWRVKGCLAPVLNEPTAYSQLLPLRPLLKHGKEGRDLINRIWERASAESNRKEGPSHSFVTTIAKQEAPEIIGKKREPKSRSKQKAYAAIGRLAEQYDAAALRAALTEYLKELA